MKQASLLLLIIIFVNYALSIHDSACKTEADYADWKKKRAHTFTKYVDEKPVVDTFGIWWVKKSKKVLFHNRDHTKLKETDYRIKMCKKTKVLGYSLGVGALAFLGYRYCYLRADLFESYLPKF